MVIYFYILLRKEIMIESLDKPKKRVLGLTGNMWIYAFGVMGINLAIGLVNSYQAEFFDKIM